MTERADTGPGPFDGDLQAPDLPLLREHIRDVGRWVLGDAVGDRLDRGRCDELAGELAVILSSGLAPALRGEITAQAEKLVAGLQRGPLSFDYHHELLVAGFPVRELVQLLDAVGRLVDAGVGEAIGGLHETHRHLLYRVHDQWLAKQPEVVATPEKPADNR